MKDRICVGVVGAGIISDIYLKNMTTRFGNLHVKSLSARRVDKAVEKASKYGLIGCSVDDMMSDPEIELIVNLTPVSSHEEIVRKALDAGKHIYTEKTMTDHFDSAVELCKTADRKGLWLGCAPDTFLGSSLQSARRAIDQGILGDITGFAAIVNRNNDMLLSHFPIGRFPGAGICNERGLGPSEMADALQNSRQTFRTSKELGLHVLEVLQGMLDSGTDQAIHSMVTTCSKPEPFYTLH